DISAVNVLYPTGPVTTIKEAAKDPLADRITVKEIRKDPLTDPVTTLKELRKDPISELVTIKEMRKDLIADPTVKEAGRDPTGGTVGENVTVPGGQLGLGPARSPFILAGASRVAGDTNQLLAEAQAQVQELAEALALVQEQQTELAAAYDAAVQALGGLQ